MRAHLIGGPLDAVIELGLPLLIFAALWWWSARKERERGSGSAGPSEHNKRKREADVGPTGPTKEEQEKK
jgi:hypothetical protein